MRLTRLLNHLTWSQLQEYEEQDLFPVQCSDGIFEEVLVEIIEQ